MAVPEHQVDGSVRDFGAMTGELNAMAWMTGVSATADRKGMNPEGALITLLPDALEY